MKYSRRQLGLLLPALAAATASAQTKGQEKGAAAPPVRVEDLPVMKTQAFLYKDVPDTINGKNKSKRLFKSSFYLVKKKKAGNDPSPRKALL